MIMDIFSILDSDAIERIFTLLDDLADLVHAAAVSRTWRGFVIDRGLVKKLCLKWFPQLSRVAGVMELNKPGQEDCKEDVSSFSLMEFEKKLVEHRVYASLAKSATVSSSWGCIADAISASSTDNYPQETVANTLEPRDIIADGASYWSSTGQQHDDVPETLIYKLTSNLCVITEISIRPFQAFFQPHLPIYSSKAVRFRMGHPKFPKGLEDDLSNEYCHDDKFAWTYTSQVFEMDQLYRLQKFKLPEPVLFIGGYLQIELLGRVQRQEVDGLYYICVSHVKVAGHSLAPALDAEIIDQSGKIILKRNLQENIHLEKSPELTGDDTLEDGVRHGAEFAYQWPWQWLAGVDDSDEEF